MTEFCGFLKVLLQDENFKINLTSLRLILQITERLGSQILPFCNHLIDVVVPKYADGKSVIRQAATNVIIQLMRYTNPGIILDAVLSYANDERSRVRGEIYNLLSISLLSFKGFSPDVKSFAKFLMSGLNDDKVKVKYNAVEACAVLANHVKPQDLTSIFQTLGLDELNLELIKSRLEDSRLPYLNLEGGLEHIYSQNSMIPPSIMSFATTDLSPNQGKINKYPMEKPLFNQFCISYSFSVC